VDHQYHDIGYDDSYHSGRLLIMGELVYLLCDYTPASRYAWWFDSAAGVYGFCWPSVHQPNLVYSYWLWVDPLIRAPIFATRSSETLCEERNLQHALPI